MNTTTFNPSEALEIVQEWQRAVNELIEQVIAWARDEGWDTRQSNREVTEESLGAYTVPVLEIDTPEGRLIMEPIARIIFGGRGRIDFYAWPTLYRVMLLRKSADAAWIVRTDSGLNWPQPWSEATFITLAKGLLGAS